MWCKISKWPHVTKEFIGIPSEWVQRKRVVGRVDEDTIIFNCSGGVSKENVAFTELLK